MERIKFIRNCGAVCAGAFILPALLQSCAGMHYAVFTEEGKTIRVSKSEFLSEKGSPRKFVAVRITQSEFPIVLYKVSENEFVALSTECSHNSCEVRPYDTLLVCPCHGSEFSTTGKVQSPPADSDLKQFKTSTDSEYITIQL
ncbi:MAG: Rieske (2Fe-2S) protein [Flavobacteriales bacterium]|nr:Rieske (2Fe-2S) protein [Flavobacteriales bacterium]